MQNLQAQKLNKEIFETIYYHALRTSADLAAEEGVYETYPGSPVSKVFTSFPSNPRILNGFYVLCGRKIMKKKSIGSVWYFVLLPTILSFVCRVFYSQICGMWSPLVSGTGPH
jgi:ribonucleotide reductase alpha subunit